MIYFLEHDAGARVVTQAHHGEEQDSDEEENDDEEVHN